MLNGRSRRQNAGNRLRELLEQEHVRLQAEGIEETTEKDDGDLDYVEEDVEDVAISDTSSEGETDDENAINEEAEKEISRQEKLEKRRSARLTQNKTERTLKKLLTKRTKPSEKASVKRARKIYEPEAAIRSSTRTHTVSFKQSVEEKLQRDRYRRRQGMGQHAGPRAKHSAMTQQQRLEEASRTEAANISSLRHYVLREEERRLRMRRNATRSRALHGPILRFVSRQFQDRNDPKTAHEQSLYLAPDTYPLIEPWQSQLPTVPDPSMNTCVFTGLRARYIDPKTGISFANTEAYEALRKACANEYTWSSLLGIYY
ncbi:Swr1 complex subunit Swc2 [Schizosaccharomyces japonicus yFS275]|uniref:Swr1 complex subunit Swc2 n=1 Tax=Schizosaccharomyces japonicus (strain yFS275 / FY16936) TaxID=402676 RepID=B6K789_SCHJY|nr:Swr1 complex subunit Swc2 [Schizosaccharomyces japonicus yFS275]EEB09393.1 Swr1 complex subunit Swc2 [Schizosaccharomyces japonicus yFS275]